jgi:Ni/Co efflux regulator RcnB
MNRADRKANWVALAVAGVLMVGQAIAQPPPWAADKEGKGASKATPDSGKSAPRAAGKKPPADGARVTITVGAYFVDNQRTLVRDYYDEQFRRGFCPPGLAKKQNGCMPPGQLRKWEIGRPLPREVIFHDLPQGLVVQLGLPPAGYRYVRVASDILLIAIGTGMVIDAIRDLGRM